MKFFNEITIFENRRRLGLLKMFNDLFVAYSKNIEYASLGHYNENEEAVQVRQKINFCLDEIRKIIFCAGISTSIYYAPPPAIGGIAGDVDLFLNLFNLSRFQIEYSSVSDLIHRARGVYESSKNEAVIRTFNPFFWLLNILETIASMPFIILGRMGFDQGALEGSFLGKFTKSIITFITTFAALLTVLERLGRLEQFKHFLKASLK